ncbi:winged helix-turn-helix domain-containing protein [Halomonas sp. M4R1S46]|uniref:winged helix-turn-helix domain-containing protein n=1 Tax=Halomonas sp. M4R1S46 TaxID=2982692 RepID=UPI0021E44E6F|nr:winged helix-turn-helix domain-containing protein [Halomonas sp. M4R1S46]UYG09178.1 winged helix-turn-helix domain-containing protein [Halomonas sp. M4R1S46]
MRMPRGGDLGPPRGDGVGWWQGVDGAAGEGENNVVDRIVDNEVIGREAELARLRALLAGDGPRVAHLHGVAGIGKTALLKRFVREALAEAACWWLDCRDIEPTPEGCTGALAQAADTDAEGLPALLETLAGRAPLGLIVLDSVEAWRLLDTWLCHRLAPRLPDNLRLVLSGRHHPSVNWAAGEFTQPPLNLPLAPLANADATRLLIRLGLAPARAAAVSGRLHGHPLAIRLAATTLRERPDHRLTDASLQRVMDELTELYLADVDDGQGRRLLEGAAVVRRVTVPLLHALFPDMAAEPAYESLRRLDFTEVLPDGLALHDAVKEPLAHTLRARDPERFLDYRRWAWQALARRAAVTANFELWRYTADMLYLIDNPVVREAFFPSGAQALVVEPARPEHGVMLERIIATHEGESGSRALRRWWRCQPEAFVVVRDEAGACRGFYCRFDPARVAPECLAEDPVTASWQTHLAADPLPEGRRALFIRRWLGEAAGERPGDVQAAAWLDLKRTYMEMRPSLARVYLTVTDLAPYAAVAATLGFRHLPAHGVRLDGRDHATAVLDFGAGSVDGWLARLAAAELGLARPEPLDRDARELVLADGRRQPLTPLEFGVFGYLVDREGEAVSRERLLREVWHSHYTGWSNKVDAVVAGLRRKLGPQAGCIETVTGVGYRYRPDPKPVSSPRG